MFQLHHNFDLIDQRKSIAKMENEQMISKEKTSRPLQETPGSQLRSTPKKFRFELECRKELRLFFGLKKAQKGRKQISQVKKCLQLLLNMFKRQSNQSDAQDYYNALSKNMPNIYKQQSNWNNQKTFQKNHQYIIILTIITDTLQNLPRFNIELLSTSGKIIYRKILFENWQLILTFFSQINVQREKIIYFVEGRSKAEKFIAENREFKSCLEIFADLEDIQNRIQIKMTDNSSRSLDSKQAQVIQGVLQQYFFIKSSLLNRFGWQGTRLTQGQTQYIIIINNLFACLPIYKSQGRLFDQIRLHCLTICKAIQKCMRWDIDSFNQQHFPASLQNALTCWMCNKRVYIYCPTCSQNEKKRISLCHKCYDRHHHHNIKREQPNFNLMEQWNTANKQVESMLQQALKE